MGLIVDSKGRKVDTGILKEEVAAPVLTGLRNPWWPSVASVLTPELLGAILGSMDMGAETFQFLTLCYELEDRWQRFYSAISTRKLAVSGLEFNVEPADDTAPSKKAADFIKDVLAPRKVTPLISESLDALSKGYSCVEIMWDRTGSQWFPKNFVYRDARFFRYDLMTGQELRIYDMQDPGFGIPIPPFKFIVHQPQIKCGLPIKRGLARLALAPYLCQTYGIRDWMAFAESMGIPLRLGKYPTTATADERKALLRAVGGIGTDAHAIIPNTMEIDFEAHGTTSGGDKIFQSLVEHFNGEMTIAILGQSATTQGTPGKLGNEDAQQNVREDIRTSDALQMAATIDRDVIKPLIDLNLGPLPEGKYPTCKLHTEKAEDLNQTATALSVYIDRGLRVKESEIRAKFKGLTEPEDGDAVLTPSSKGGGGGQQPDGTQAAGPVAHTETPIKQPSPDAPTDDQEGDANPDDAEKKALKQPKGKKTAKASVDVLVDKVVAGIALTSDERLALAASVNGKDTVDELADECVGKWHKVIDPMRAQVQKLADSSKDAKEFKAKLGKLKLDKAALIDSVATATFTARALGLHTDKV